MIAALRQTARQTLPDPLRRRLGAWFGIFEHLVLFPLGGWYFDLVVRRYRTEGCQFIIPKDLTSRGYRSCFLGDSYEREERELIRRFVIPEDRVLELGACLGIVSCVTNTLLADRSAHVVVEGNPMLIGALHRNRNLNGAGFLIENCAVSDRRDIEMYLHPHYVVGGTIQRKVGTAVRVPGRSIKDLIERHGPFSVLIMDIEGAELAAMQHAPAVLSGFRLIILELHPWATGEDGAETCRQILREAGFDRVGTAGDTEAWQKPATA